MAETRDLRCDRSCFKKKWVLRVTLLTSALNSFGNRSSDNQFVFKQASIPIPSRSLCDNVAALTDLKVKEIKNCIKVMRRNGEITTTGFITGDWQHPHVMHKKVHEC